MYADVGVRNYYRSYSRSLSVLSSALIQVRFLAFGISSMFLLVVLSKPPPCTMHIARVRVYVVRPRTGPFDMLSRRNTRRRDEDIQFPSVVTNRKFTAAAAAVTSDMIRISGGIDDYV